MKISDFLVTESLDSDVSGTIIRATNDLFTVSANIAGRKIVFNASSYEDDNGATTWEIEFIEKTPGSATYGKSGSGGELKVFSFVITCIKELVSRYRPDVITFSSHKADSNRTSLYSKLMKRVSIPGYVADEVISDNHADIFRIVRTK